MTWTPGFGERGDYTGGAPPEIGSRFSGRAQRAVPDPPLPATGRYDDPACEPGGRRRPDSSTPPGALGGAGESEEDQRTQRRRMSAVWAAAGSALAVTVASRWFVVARNGGRPTGGDMVVHAGAAEWLRTLPWWDWRGWSGWFFGGQAMGVNYPPLGHALLRFTHTGHAQMAAVAVGLLVLLPYGAWRLARSVGYTPREQRAAVGAVLVLVALAGHMHWLLPGFHAIATGFGPWPAMLAAVLGLFCTAWAARCHSPVRCGVVAGIAVLFNATVVPGVAIVCAVVLLTSGVSPRRAARWAAKAAFSALAVCAWWLVPFVAGWDRLVRFDVSLRQTWRSGGLWGIAVLAALAVAAAWSVRGGSAPSRRLVAAAAVGLLAALLADQFGYLRGERWLVPAVLLAAAATAGLLVTTRARPPRPSARAWAVLGVVFVFLFVAITRRFEFVPLALWVLWSPRRTWVWAGALAWSAVLVLVPFWEAFEYPGGPASGTRRPLELAAAGAGAAGLVYLDPLYERPVGDTESCAWGHPWATTALTGGRIGPLAGLYRETSHAAEFINPEVDLRRGQIRQSDSTRPHWFAAWSEVNYVSLDTPAAAEGLGARWFASCDAMGEVSLRELSGTNAVGVTVVSHAGEDAWHRDAAEWWVLLAAGHLPDGKELVDVPILSRGGESVAHPGDQAAEGVTLHAVGERLTVRAESAGWAWLRVPWDPDWRSVDGTPVRKGGPGHLVVWVNRGVTEVRWAVPKAVDIAAIVTTASAAVAVALLVLVDRRRRRTADRSRAMHVPGADRVVS